MPKGQSAPTMKDVAQAAGVAVGTVSKVINGPPVGEESIVRVEKAIKKLNYRVNIYARGMRSVRTRIIEVIVPNLISPFFAKLVNCINKELAMREYRMLLCTADDDPDLEQAHILWPNSRWRMAQAGGLRHAQTAGISPHVQPLEGMAETCINLILDGHWEKAPSLICLPVSYACGGTTQQ